VRGELADTNEAKENSVMNSKESDLVTIRPDLQACTDIDLEWLHLKDLTGGSQVYVETFCANGRRYVRACLVGDNNWLDQLVNEDNMDIGECLFDREIDALKTLITRIADKHENLGANASV